MKKKMISVLAATTILATGSLAHADYFITHIESEYGRGNNTLDDAQGYIVDPYNEGFTISGIVSSSDNQDWFSVEGRSGNAIGTIELGLADTGINANLYLYDATGSLLYQGSTVGQTKIIRDIVLRNRAEYYIKVEYISGVPKQPYELNIIYESFSLRSLSNIESLPQELKEELIKEGMIEDNNEDQSKEIEKIDIEENTTLDVDENLKED